MITVHIDEKKLNELNSKRGWSDYGAVISYEDLAHVLGIEYDHVKLLHFSKIQTEEASVSRAFYEKYSDDFELAGCSYVDEVNANVFFYHNPTNDWNISVYLKNGKLETYNPFGR